MKKYCSKCGTKLNDEEKCPKCMERKAPFLKDFVQKPIDTILKKCDESNFNLGLIFFALTSFAIALFGVLFLKQYMPFILIHHHETFGIRYFIVIFTLTYLALYVLGYLLYWIQKEWFHGVMHYKETIAATSLSSLALTAVTIVSMLLISAPFILLFGLLTLGFLLFILLIYSIVERKSEIDSNQLPYFMIMVIGITGILLFFVIYILR